MGPDWIHPRTLRELTEMLIKTPISQQSWLSREVLVDWKLANARPIYKIFWMRDMGTTGLTLVMSNVIGS